MKQYWKEIVPQNIDDARKISGFKYDLERNCMFFFPPEWENNQTFNTLNDSSFHNWTKKLNENGASKFFFPLDFKSPYIEYKPLRQ